MRGRLRSIFMLAALVFAHSSHRSAILGALVFVFGLLLHIASKGQLAVRSALRAIHEGTELGLREGLDLEARLFGELCDSEDKKEGTSAFLEKRQPRFQDR